MEVDPESKFDKPWLPRPLLPLCEAGGASHGPPPHHVQVGEVAVAASEERVLGRRGYRISVK